MSITNTPVPPLSRAYQSQGTDSLLTLLTKAVVDYGRTARVEEIAAAATVLQRHAGGRPTALGTRDSSDISQAFREQVDAAGGFLATPMGTFRHAMTGRPAPAGVAGTPCHETGGRYTVDETTDELGLEVFPSRHLAGTSPKVVVYERGLIVGDLLAALAAGDAIEADRLTEEIRTASGQPALTA